MPERRDAELVRADNDHADRADNDDLDKDRRRSPRFRCGGHAEINCLPSSGILLPGTIRDLSLHGCCVDTSLPIDCGVRAELVVRVNAASFRKEVEDGRHQLARLTERFPFLRTILPVERSEESSDGTASAGKNRSAEEQSVVITVDLFG